MEKPGLQKFRMYKNFLALFVLSGFFCSSANSTSAISGDSKSYTHGHSAHRRLIAKGVKNYNHGNKSTSQTTALSKFMKNLGHRINESWNTYGINVMRAEILLELDKEGNIVSTKVKSAKADQTKIDDALESIKFATPFGHLPGASKTMQFIVTFTDQRVSVDRGAGAAGNTGITARKNPKSGTVFGRATSANPLSQASNQPFDTIREARELYEFLDGP